MHLLLYVFIMFNYTKTRFKSQMKFLMTNERAREVSYPVQRLSFPDPVPGSARVTSTFLSLSSPDISQIA